MLTLGPGPKNLGPGAGRSTIRTYNETIFRFVRIILPVIRLWHYARCYSNRTAAVPPSRIGVYS